MPFFNAWEFAGKFPDILKDPVVGEQASNLYADDAPAMLKSIVRERWLTARGVIGLFPANSVDDDDVEIYTDESRTRVLTKLHFLRQQKGKPTGQSHDALSDFIAPKNSGRRDYIGAFAVTAGVGIEPHLERFERAHDDYSSIMLKALADRFAEAFAERMHERVRREFWGYAPEERLHQRSADQGRLSRHPSGAGLSGLPGSHREGDLVEAARSGGQRGHQDHRVVRDVSDGGRQRLVFLTSGLEVLCRRQDRLRPGAELRRAQEDFAGGGAALAVAESWATTRTRTPTPPEAIEGRCAACAAPARTGARRAGTTPPME